jgi:hypothetical protein
MHIKASLTWCRIQGTDRASPTDGMRCDRTPTFSNWGPKVAMVAPGTGIWGAHCTNASAYSGRTGTSMSSPHVAGGIALIMSKEVRRPGASDLSPWRVGWGFLVPKGW